MSNKSKVSTLIIIVVLLYILWPSHNNKITLGKYEYEIAEDYYIAPDNLSFTSVYMSIISFGMSDITDKSREGYSSLVSIDTNKLYKKIGVKSYKKNIQHLFYQYLKR